MSDSVRIVHAGPQPYNAFSSDDFHTYGAVPVETSYEGCGGEFCPGFPPAGESDATWYAGTGFTRGTVCGACKSGARTVVTMYRRDGI